MPDDWNGHEEDPYICDEIRDVCEVCECDKFEAVPFHGCVPERFNGPAGKSQCHGDPNAPRDDESCGRDNEFAEQRDDKDTVVEGQDPELDTDERDIVEVTEYIIALHHTSVRNSSESIIQHTFRTIIKSWGSTAITCLPIP